MTITTPERGFDCAFNTTALVPKIAKEGLGYAGRYYGGSDGKDLHYAEAVALFSIDPAFGIISYYEAQGDKPAGFQKGMGTTAAKIAGEQAEKAGQPHGTPIHFAVDFDPDSAVETNLIQPYYEEIVTEYDNTHSYTVGGYGSGLTGEILDNKFLISNFVLGAIGWRDGAAFQSRANVLQKPPSDPYHWGVSLDPLIAQTPYFGAWNLRGPLPFINLPLPTLAKLGTVSDFVRSVQKALGFTGKDIDGVYGPKTLAAVQNFERTNKLVVFADGAIYGPLAKMLGLSVLQTP